MFETDDVLSFWEALPADARSALVMAKDLDILAESDDAEAAIRAARYYIGRFPLDRRGWEVLIEGLVRLECLDEAMDGARSLASIMPESHSPSRHLEILLAREGMKSKAADQWMRVATLRKDDPEMLDQVGDALMGIGAAVHAVSVYRGLLRDKPLNPKFVTRHLQALENTGDVHAFAASARQAVSIAPSLDGFYVCIGRAQRRLGDPAAEQTLRRALHLVPDCQAALLDLGIVKNENGDLEGSFQVLKKTVAYHPGLSATWLNLGTLFLDMGFVEEGLKFERRAAQLGKDERIARANIVMYMHYLPSATRADLRVAIDDFAERFASEPGQAPPATPRNPDPNRPLTVGLISTSFFRHPALSLSIKAFEHLDREAFRLIAYTGRGRVDALRHRFETLATVKTLATSDDDSLVEIIRCDEVDILIDMAGHGAGSKLHVYAQRPAPVQVKWVGGLFNTTGVPAIDWLIADAVQVPEGDDAWYTERVYRMPHGYVVFEPPPYAPPVWSLPANIRGGVTFGSFNNPLKINDRVVALWARILERVPGSRLLLKGRRFGVEQLPDLYRARFQKHGLDPTRLEMRGYTNHQDHLRTHNEVDIALDPWPYSGGLTTCESLWMGVPVITMPGPTFAGRHAATHLANVGLTDWIVDSENAYVDLAVSWATRLDDLAALRRSLRQRVAESPLCDGPRFARDFEAALRFMWRDHLARGT